MAPREAAGDKTFDSETVAVVLYALLESGVTLGKKHYDLMSGADTKGRSANVFQHNFREVKNRAKEIQAKHGGGNSVPATPKSRGGGSKRKKAAAEMNDGAEQDDDEETPAKTPSKKRVKSEIKSEAKEEADEDGELV